VLVDLIANPSQNIIISVKKIGNAIYNIALPIFFTANHIL